MSPDLQKAFAEFITQLTRLLQQGETLAGQQIPLLLQEKILLARVESLVYLLCAIVMLTGVILILKHRTVWGKSCFTDDNYNPKLMEGRAPALLARVGTVALAVAGVGLFAWDIQYCLTAWLAPRVMLLNWLKDLVR